MTEIPVSLSMTSAHHDWAQEFLFPGDGKEAVIIALCTRRAGDRRHRLLVRNIIPIPYEECSVRTAQRVTWPTSLLEPILEEAADNKLTIIKIHSHPAACNVFSPTDDVGDSELFPMIGAWVDADIPHGSAVMLPDGQLFGRIVKGDGSFSPLSSINVVGDDLHFYFPEVRRVENPEFLVSQEQVFGAGTTNLFRKLSIGIVGCSGTGSPTIEQLTRHGTGELVMVDDDHMEIRNLNRIPSSTKADAERKRMKVDVLADAVERIGLGTRVIRIKKNLWDPEAVRQIAQCDIVVGCMDSIDGRYLLNKLATAYLIPYFDIGVRLDTYRDGPNAGLVREVCGTIHYLQPGKSSLLSRGLISMEGVAAAGLRRRDPAAYARQLSDGYIAGVHENSPAVACVNTFAASQAVHELIARFHPYREEPNSEFAAVTFSLASMELMPEPEEGYCNILGKSIAAGDTVPLLREMELAESAQ